VTTDGQYTIFPQDNGSVKTAFSVYCENMASLCPVSPPSADTAFARICGASDWLTLAHSAATGEPASNYTTSGGDGFCASVLEGGAGCPALARHYTRVRLDTFSDPLVIDPFFFDFSTLDDPSQATQDCWLNLACGTDQGNSPYNATDIPYGTAGSCDPNGGGSANMDLRDTGFYFTNVGYELSGTDPYGQGDVDQTTNQTATVTGGGTCGFYTPIPSNTESNFPGLPIPITQH
jgi:hypothetical protein